MSDIIRTFRSRLDQEGGESGKNDGKKIGQQLMCQLNVIRFDL